MLGPHPFFYLSNVSRLIAIMLGRLEMDVDECLSAYRQLMATIFEKRSSWLQFNWKGGIKARFDSVKLESAFKEVVASRRMSESDLFNDGVERGCRV